MAPPAMMKAAPRRSGLLPQCLALAYGAGCATASSRLRQISSQTQRLKSLEISAAFFMRSIWASVTSLTSC